MSVKKILFLFIFLLLIINICYSQNVTLQYRCGNSTANTNQISPYFNLINNDSQNLDLTTVEIRYYYTMENPATETVNIDYAAIGASNVIAETVLISGNEYYLKVSFSSSVNPLLAGAQTDTIQLRLNKSDWSNYDQANDYSFDGTITNFTNYDKVTVYSSGTLIWGTPSGEGPVNILPDVNIQSPTNGQTFNAGDNITIQADASDSDGTISKVEFYADSGYLGEDTSSPYEYTWNGVAQGNYTITAKAIDDQQGEKTSAGISITVNVTSNNLPTVEITSPQNNSEFTENTQITVNANANDTDGSITKVEFYLNSSKIAEDTTSAYSTVIDGLSPGNYNITAIAYDNDNGSTTSGNISITVNPDQNDDYVNIPAKIEAEDYISGGEGVGYHDTTAGNDGGAYKSDDVDIESCNEGGYNVGWTADGEWLKYKIYVPETTDYDLQLRVARESSGNGQLHLEIDDQDVTGLMDAPSTSNWQTFTTIEKTNIQLTAGQHELKLYLNSDSININWINIIYSTGSSEDPIPVTIKISSNTSTARTITLSPAPTHMGNSSITGINGYEETVYYTDPVDISLSAGTDFSSWSGSLSGSTNPATLSITVNQTYTVTGTFTEIINGENNDDWLSTDGNKIVDSLGREVRLIGINYFGFETELHGFEGLAYSSLDDSLDFIADYGFNIIRIPISVQLVTEWKNGNDPLACYAYEETGIELDYTLNPGFEGITSQQMLDYTMNYCKQKGLKVMLDMHRVIHFKKKNIWFYQGESEPAWVPPGEDPTIFKDKYRQTFNYTVEDFYQAWEYLVNRYKDSDTLVAIDIFNEPHGMYDNSDSDGDGETDGLAAKWDNSQDPNNLKYIAEQVAQRIHAINPNLLIMVEGIQQHNGTSTWWGGNLKGVAEYQVDLGSYNNKLVYEPHDYGPGVASQPWFTSSFDKTSLYYDCWQNFWFFIHEQQTAPVLVGEWGSRYEVQNDIDWFNYFISFIDEHDLNYFYWCFNPSSHDTGGIVKYDEFYNQKTLVIHDKYYEVKKTMWFTVDDKPIGLDHVIPLGANGISVTDYYE